MSAKDDRIRWDWDGHTTDTSCRELRTGTGWEAENIDALRARLAARKIVLDYAWSPGVPTPWSNPHGRRRASLRRAVTPTGMLMCAVMTALGPVVPGLWLAACAVLAGLCAWTLVEAA